MNNDTPGGDDGADDGAGASPPASGRAARCRPARSSPGWATRATRRVGAPRPRRDPPPRTAGPSTRTGACGWPSATPTAPSTVTPTRRPRRAPAGPAATRPALPGEWRPLALTGGRPGSGPTVSRMWIGPAGFTPIDGAARASAILATTVTAPSRRRSCAGRCPPSSARSSPRSGRRVVGRLHRPATGSSASGAYQFIDSQLGGVRRLPPGQDAPPGVQDAKAVELVAAILERNGGDVTTVPVTWYLGHVPVGDEWDRVPRVGQQADAARVPGPVDGSGTPGCSASPTRGSRGLDRLDGRRHSATCRTVVVDEGRPGAPQYVLTQAQAFVGDTSGRAALDVADPCDPARAVPVAAPDRRRPRRAHRRRRRRPLTAGVCAAAWASFAREKEEFVRRLAVPSTGSARRRATSPTRRAPGMPGWRRSSTCTRATGGCC